MSSLEYSLEKKADKAKNIHICSQDQPEMSCLHSEIRPIINRTLSSLHQVLKYKAKLSAFPLNLIKLTQLAESKRSKNGEQYMN